MKVPTRYTSPAVGEMSPSIRRQRSVDGMRALMPLQLASPTLPTSKFAALERLQRTVEEETKSQEDRHLQFTRDFPCKSAKPQRDIPIYAPKNSPILEHAYLWSGESDLSRSLPDLSSVKKPFIINDYELIDDDSATEIYAQSESDINSRRASYQSVHWEEFGMDQGRYSGFTEDSRRPSDLDTLVDNEGAWLRSSLNKWNDGRSECLPYILSQSMPGKYLYSDTRSWASEDDEDILACATALATRKASVIDVNKRQPSGLSITIPPRTSSLIPGTDKPIDRNSWQTFGACSSFYDDSMSSDGNGDEELEIQSETATRSNPPRPNSRYLLDLTDRPSSPSTISEDSFCPPENTSSLHVNEPSGPIIETIHKNDSLHEIISDLESHLYAFPSKMLVDHSDCILAMRKYLKYPESQHQTPCSRYEAPLSPAMSEESLFLDDDSDEVEERDFVRHPYHNKRSSRLRFQTTLPDQSFGPDLAPLTKIFPETSNFMRSALYAHLLAYVFVTSLTPAHVTSPTHKRNSSSFRRNSRCIPTKAAELLGMTERERLNTDVEVPSATKALEDHLVGHIGTLVTEMERRFDVPPTVGEPQRIGRTLLLSLVEVVKGIEGA